MYTWGLSKLIFHLLSGDGVGKQWKLSFPSMVNNFRPTFRSPRYSFFVSYDANEWAKKGATMFMKWSVIVISDIIIYGSFTFPKWNLKFWFIRFLSRELNLFISYMLIVLVCLNTIFQSLHFSSLQYMEQERFSSFVLIS